MGTSQAYRLRRNRKRTRTDAAPAPSGRGGLPRLAHLRKPGTWTTRANVLTCCPVSRAR